MMMMMLMMTTMAATATTQVPVVVAANKCDMPGANPLRVFEQLAHVLYPKALMLPQTLNLYPRPLTLDPKTHIPRPETLDPKS